VTTLPAFKRRTRGGDSHTTGTHIGGFSRQYVDRVDSLELGFAPPTTHCFINSYNIWPVSDTRCVTFGPMEFQGAHNWYTFHGGDLPAFRPAGATLWGFNEVGDEDHLFIVNHAETDRQLSVLDGFNVKGILNNAVDGSSVVFVDRVGDNTWVMWIDQNFMDEDILGYLFVFKIIDDQITLTNTITIGPGDGGGLTLHYSGTPVHLGWDDGTAAVIQLAFGFVGLRRFTCDLNGGGFTEQDFDFSVIGYPQGVFSGAVTVGDTTYVEVWLQNFPSSQFELSVLRFDVDTFAYQGKTVLKTLGPVGSGYNRAGSWRNADQDHGVFTAQDIAGDGILRGAFVSAETFVPLTFLGPGAPNPFRKWKRTHVPGEILDLVWDPPDYTVHPGETDEITGNDYLLPMQSFDVATGDPVGEPIWQDDTLDQLTDEPMTRLSDLYFLNHDIQNLLDPPDPEAIFWSGVRYVHLGHFHGGGIPRGVSVHKETDAPFIRRVG
jgi:hypothetical protein